MKVLILSITTGEGHNSSARALVDAVQKRGATCVFHDAYYCASRPVYHVVNRVYRLCGGPWRHAYGTVYRWSERHIGASGAASLGAAFNRLLSPRVARMIKKEAPDVILYTHVFAGQILESMRRQGKLGVPAIGIVTDFTLHPRWERLTRLGPLVLAHQELKEVAQERGFSPEQLHTLGIPLNPRFLCRHEKEEARKELGLKADMPTVLYVCGNTGYGSPAKLLRQLDQSTANFQLIAVCGNSQKHYKALHRLLLRHPYQLVKYTDRMELYMDAADCIISKPGGLSVSEALTRHLPLFIVNPIPGHEERNAEFLCRQGAAQMMRAFSSPDEALNRFFSESQFADALRAGAESIARPNATNEIADLALQIGSVATKK